MSLISMATFCTETNNRAPLLKQTLDSLLKTVDFQKHRIFIIVNSAVPESVDAIFNFGGYVGKALEVIYPTENIGTARAVNKGWKHRVEGEMCIKMDDDVVIHRAGWVDEMEEALIRDPKIGIIGLKRKDLWECPWYPDPAWRSVLRMLPHEAGQTWIITEDVHHVMGTCQAYSPALLEKIGYLYQPFQYGFDDSLAAIRCKVAGLRSCFLHGYEIDHIDPGGDAYTLEKVEATKSGSPNNVEYHRLKNGYQNGTIGIYYDADGGQPDSGPMAGEYTWRLPNLQTR